MNRIRSPISKMVISIRRHRNRQSKNNELSLKHEHQNKLINLNHLRACDPEQYLIKNLIHESESLNIHHADHISTNHKVVIKMINLDSEEFLESVIHEIEAITKLRHANILPMLASFVKDNYLWNVMAYAEFGSTDLWSRPSGLPEFAIAFIIKDVLSALNYLHKRGIIHRAVCGSHILINSNGTCMLTGLKYSTSVLQKGRWQSNIHQYPKNSVKLLNYLAPEILEQNLIGYNSKSDIYSVGIVCCELANGCIPFEDIVLTEMLLDKLTGNFPRPLDSTCEEIRNFPTNDENLSPEVKEKYNLYKNRTFSPSFHTFTTELCLNFDSCSRPTASELVNHNFIKQTKKCHQNLIELLQSMPTSRKNCSINNNNNNDNKSGQKNDEKQQIETIRTTLENMNIGNNEIDWLF